MTDSSSDFIAAAYFPGPRSENEASVRAGFQAVLDDWFDWRKGMFTADPAIAPPSGAAGQLAVRERELLSRRLGELCAALTAESPTYTPRYIAHMKADLTLPALFGWMAAMLHNPNNTSREASLVGTPIEQEAIAMLAEMLGYEPDRAQGHFTSGGTVANFEAVWRARYRLDHWLSLALYVSETTGEPLDVFAAAHMGWDRFHALRAAYGVSDAVLRSCSAVAHNPAAVFRRISAASGRDYLGPVVLVPGNKHYSWRKAANVFALGEDSFWSIALDDQGRLDLADFERLVLRAEAEGRPVLMVVSVAGTTEAGEIDPIDRLHDLLEQWESERGWRIWRHVDAAYGGFLCSILGGDESGLAPDAVRALRAVGRADSITIDPHKLGYVPYACGAFLTRDASRYVVPAFDAPYIDRPELGEGKWSCTLEGSRSATGAAAIWLTGKTLGFGPSGFGALLAEHVRSRQAFQRGVAAALPFVRFLDPCDSNILCFSLAEDGEALSSSNRRTEALFAAFRESWDFCVSKTVLGAEYTALNRRHVEAYGGEVDEPGLVMIRCVFMNPYWSAYGDRLIEEFVDFVREVAAPAAASPALAAEAV